MTKPHLDIIQKSETKLADVIDEMMEQTIRNTETIMIR